MRRPSKILLRICLALTLVLLAVVVAASLWPTPPPQIVSLPNGQKFQFIAATYGTNHLVGGVARVINRLQASVAASVAKHLPRRWMTWPPYQTSIPELFVWFKEVGTNTATPGPPSAMVIAAKLADEHGAEAGSRSMAIDPRGELVVGPFAIMPRRTATLELRLHQLDLNMRTVHEIGRVHFPNPLYGQFPDDWKPEPLPSLKSAGDQDVRLEGIAITRTGYDSAPGPGETGLTRITVSLSQPAKANESWVIETAELSDATGNTIHAGTTTIGSHLSNPNYRRAPGWLTYRSYVLDDTLWPGETAWRLKITIKRDLGFAPDELVTFKNVPVPALGSANAPNLTNLFHGIPLVLSEFARKPNLTNFSFGMGNMVSNLRLDLPTEPEGLAIDFWDMTTDAGAPEEYGASRYQSSYSLAFKSIPTNATTADITFVVQKTRTVEFLVKPPMVK